MAKHRKNNMLPKPVNVMARGLKNPLFKPRVIKSKRIYSRKKKDIMSYVE